MMVGSVGIIGRNDQGGSSVQKYDLTSLEPTGVVLHAEQTLLDAIFVSDETTGSVMNVTKLLTDGEEVIPPQTPKVNDEETKINGVKFIWAVGFDPYVIGHQLSGSVILTLDPCGDGGSAQVTTATPYSKAMKVHGIIATVAFGALAPLAMLASTLKSFLDFTFMGQKAWIVLHGGLNFLSLILGAAALGVAIKAKNDQDYSHFAHPHEKAGLILFLIFTLQVINGALRPKPVQKSKSKPSMHSSSDGFTDGSALEVVEYSSDEMDVPGKPSKWRIVWERMHKVTGLAIVALTLYLLNSGLGSYQALVGKVQIWNTLYWVWFGVFLAFGVVLLTRLVLQEKTR